MMFKVVFDSFSVSRSGLNFQENKISAAFPLKSCGQQLSFPCFLIYHAVQNFSPNNTVSESGTGLKEGEDHIIFRTSCSSVATSL